MKTRHCLNSLTFAILLSVSILSVSIAGSAHAGITWGLTPNAAYTAGTPITFTADPTINATAPAFTGISMTATVDQAGNNFFANGSANGQLRFVNTNALNMGDMITFDFQFNMQLFSGLRPFDVPGFTRAAGLFHIAPVGAGGVDGTGLVTMGGGNSSLETYFGTTPSTGALTHTNPGVLDFNNPLDASVAVATNRAAFGSFPTSNTASFTEGSDTTRFIVALADPVRSSVDFSFDQWTFKYTNDSATPIPAGSAFIFTFAGQNPDAQLAAIPEPGGILLFSVAALGILPLRRRR